MSPVERIKDFAWMCLALLVFSLGILLVLILIPLEALYYKLYPTPSFRGDPNNGEDF